MPMIARLRDCGKSLNLFEIKCEVEDHLNFFADIVVFVVTVHIPLELSAISNNLLPPLLKGNFHMLARSTSHIGPEGGLSSVPFNHRNVLNTHTPPLWVGDVLFTHGTSKLLRTTIHDR